MVKMQEEVVFGRRRAAVAVGMVLLMLLQQVCAGPLVKSSPDQRQDSSGLHALRRIARMSPLWRILSSKPFGAYCQNNYECSTGLCRAGYCSTIPRALIETINY